jgi:hypothetical protein
VRDRLLMNVSKDALIAAILDQRFHLMGDEDTGVGLYCRDCFDGGRPLAYLSGLGAYDDLKVASVPTIPALWAEAAKHLHDEHRSTE